MKSIKDNSIVQLLIITINSIYECYYKIKPYIEKINNKCAYFRNRKKFMYIGYGSHFYNPKWIVGEKGITIGEGCTFGESIHLTAWEIDSIKSPRIQIGNNCAFGAWNHITSINNIIIGDNVLTGKWVTITDNSHGKTDKLSLSAPPDCEL